MTEPING
jgi:hypothetical protein